MSIMSEEEMKLRALMDNCAFKAAVAGVTGEAMARHSLSCFPLFYVGFALGGVMGIFFASMDASMPGFMFSFIHSF